MSSHVIYQEYKIVGCHAYDCSTLHTYNVLQHQLAIYISIVSSCKNG